MKPSRRFAPDHLDALRGRLSLLDIVGQRVPLKKSGRQSVGLCPFHDERTPSFTVRDETFHCFGCGAHGDVFAWIMRTQNVSFVEAVKRAASNAGYSDDPAEVERDAQRAEERRRLAERERAKETAEALALWRQALPAEGSPVENYLRRRGIEIPVPGTIRFYPDLPYWAAPTEKDQRPLFLGRYRAMIAAVCDPDRRIVAVHRTYLDDRGNDKAAILHPASGAPLEARKIKGPAAGGAIRLSALQETIDAGEGIETCLSILQADPKLCVWSCLSTSGLKSLRLPAEVKRVVIWPDRDRINPATGKRPGEAAAREAAASFAATGREVLIADVANLPDQTDMNDVLRGAAE